ncbi:MAG: tRNA lysidine(34) synthetase TilS [Epsilonproteobacteria bacterium]|nr:tRNA lysidine(34) synthetase TilS [Campylobacterota bacterium]
MQQLVQLHKPLIDLLQKGKNLLAFSAGVDSSALFFILKTNAIEFDLAMVDYNIRAQSKEEVKYAQKLALKYDKTLYLHSCKLDNSNFEHNARLMRYTFFTSIIDEQGYDNLITAHQLNDKLEWFLMQLGKGSGLVELLGMQEVEIDEKFNKIKPLLHVSKLELQNFLDKNDIEYFFDKSNNSKKYLRNRIRSEYATSFVNEFRDGVKNSFEYLQNDKDILLPNDKINIKKLFILKRNKVDLKNIRQIDKVAKRLGILMSKAQREEIIKTQDCVVGRKISVVFVKDLIYISPFYKAVSMPKKFKELCRVKKIPSKIRPYIYKEDIDFIFLNSQVQTLLS